MLLRSSSTPVLGSLLNSFPESPHHPSELHTTPSSIHQNCSKLSCSSNGGSHNNIGKSLLASPSVSETKSPLNGFRRVQSEGNLEEMANSSYNIDEFSFSKKAPRRVNYLETIPSFTHHNLGTTLEDYTDEEESDEEEEEEIEEFRVENLVFEEKRTKMNDYGSFRFEGEGKMYMASGLGISGINFVDGGVQGGGGGGGGGGSFRPVAFDRDGGDRHGIGMEEHYKKMLEGSPGNSMILRNYAQFLYQTKGDLERAEEHYSRAILSDPEDGEILSQYAKLIWELHRDAERATNYFERAIQASSEDSHVHAAYARFLWDIEGDEDEEEDNEAENSRIGQKFLHHGRIASVTA